MDAGVFRAIMVFLVVIFADVARIVKQRSDNGKVGEFGAKGVVAVALAFVAVDDAGQCQGHVEGVLLVVIEGVAALIAFEVTFKEIVKIFEGAADRLVVGVVVAAVENIADGITHGLAV